MGGPYKWVAGVCFFYPKKSGVMGPYLITSDQAHLVTEKNIFFTKQEF